MQPVSSNTKPDNKCLNPVTTKCVTWDGPEITCLDGTVICKGQVIENTIYLLASKLCQIYEAIGIEGINSCINNIQDGTSVTVGSSSTLQQVFSAIITKVCSLNARVETLENTDCPEIRAVVPVCMTSDPTLNAIIVGLQGWNSATSTLPIEVYATFLAQVICSILIDITSIQSKASQIEKEIASLWDTLNNCTNNCSLLVQPTCTNNFTLNPNNEPVFVGDAYTYLETEFCQLQSAIGTTDDITDAVLKQCPNLNDQDRLSAGGVMSSIGGWINAPVTLADSINNMWLTVCDMRAAVQQVLDGCCFSLCSYLQLGYDVIWDATGQIITISFNTPGFATIYNQAPPAGSASFTTAPGSPLPAWVTTQFPTAPQTNVLITLNDGTVTGVINTSLKLNQLAVAASGFVINLPVAIPGYDNTSINQTINISFQYTVDDGVTVPLVCEFDQTDGLPFECCAPQPAPNSWAYNIQSSTGSDMTIKVFGLLEDTPPIAIPGPNTVTSATPNTLTDIGATFPATLAGTGYGYLITVAGQTRYITNVIGTDTLTVNSNWTTLPTPGTPYIIEDIYWTFPLSGPTFPCGALTSPLIDLRIKVVTLNSSFNPNDENTWDIVTQAPSVTPSVISTTGYVLPDGTLDPNQDYAVVVYAQYACDYSIATIYNAVTPIAASLTIQIGAPGSPVPNVFNSNLTISVNNIISNATTANLPNENATLASPAAFALNLPVLPNVSRFQFSPAKAHFNQLPNTTPLNYAICGLTFDPWAQTTGPNPVWNRDVVVGLYRGYEVSIFYLNNQAVSTPLLDACNVPYKTNSLDDPNLLFIYNQPFGFAGPCPAIPVALCAPAPPVPVCTPGTTGVPIVVNIPPTFSSNSFPAIARYNPTPYSVDISNDFHTMAIKNTTTVTFINDLLSGNTVSPRIICYVHVFTYDPTSPAPGWIEYSPPRYATLDTGFIAPLAPGATFTYTLPNDIIANAKYGDAFFAVLFLDRGTITTSASCNLTTPFKITPATNSQFSCRIPTLIEQTYTQTSGVFPFPEPGQPTQSFKSWSGIITENYNFDFDLTVTLLRP